MVKTDDIRTEEMNPEKSVDVQQVKEMLKMKKNLKNMLSVCASCGACADSCLMYRKSGEPESVPSYKAKVTLGKMFKKKGRLDYAELEDMREFLWGRCVLCGRCYCPYGIEIPELLSWARTICRTQGVYEEYEDNSLGV